MKKDKVRNFILIIFLVIIIGMCVGGIYLKMSFDNKQQNTCLETCPEGYELKNKNSPNCYCKEKPKPINEIVISMDNWQEYFEFDTKVNWRKDDFGDIIGLSVRQNIKLKDIYHDKLAKKSIIKFKIEGKEYVRSINIDTANKKYTLGNPVGMTTDYETTVKMDMRKNYLPSQSDYFYITPFIELSSGVMTIIEDYNVTKVEGTLYLYK